MSACARRILAERNATDAPLRFLITPRAIRATATRNSPSIRRATSPARVRAKPASKELNATADVVTDILI